MSDKILKLSQAQTLYQDLRERIDALPTDNDIPEVPVQDVQINGTSIVSQGVANVPVASANTDGIVRTREQYGINIAGQSSSYPNALFISKSTSANIKSGTEQYKPIVPYNQHESTFYGLAKAAGDLTQSASSNAVGTYTESAKSAIQQMLDVPSTTDLAAKLDAAEAGLKVVRLI